VSLLEREREEKNDKKGDEKKVEEKESLLKYLSFESI